MSESKHELSQAEIDKLQAENITRMDIKDAIRLLFDFDKDLDNSINPELSMYHDFGKNWTTLGAFVTKITTHTDALKSKGKNQDATNLLKVMSCVNGMTRSYTIHKKIAAYAEITELLSQGKLSLDDSKPANVQAVEMGMRAFALAKKFCSELVSPALTRGEGNALSAEEIGTLNAFDRISSAMESSWLKKLGKATIKDSEKSDTTLGMTSQRLVRERLTRPIELNDVINKLKGAVVIPEKLIGTTFATDMMTAHQTWSKNHDICENTIKLKGLEVVGLANLGDEQRDSCSDTSNPALPEAEHKGSSDDKFQADPYINSGSKSDLSNATAEFKSRSRSVSQEKNLDETDKPNSGPSGSAS